MKKRKRARKLEWKEVEMCLHDVMIKIMFLKSRKAISRCLGLPFVLVYNLFFGNIL